jgi:hypothetical protein
MAGLLDFLSLRDMFDGGGAGKAGQEFEGGLLSGLLNSLGIRPAGYQDRLAEQQGAARSQSRGAPVAYSPPPPAPGLTPPTVPPVTASALPPSMDELMAVLSAAPRGPYAPVGAPTEYPTMQEIAAMMEEQRMARLYGRGF